MKVLIADKLHPDVVSQLLMAVPLMGLYALSIGICYWITKRREAKLARQAAADGL